jgi:hypothetical protein
VSDEGVFLAVGQFVGIEFDFGDAGAFGFGDESQHIDLFVAFL